MGSKSTELTNLLKGNLFKLLTVRWYLKMMLRKLGSGSNCTGGTLEMRSCSSSASRCLRKNLCRVKMQLMHGIHGSHPPSSQATICPSLQGASAGKYLAPVPSMLQLRPGKHHTASEVFPGSGQMPLAVDINVVTIYFNHKKTMRY